MKAEPAWLLHKIDLRVGRTPATLFLACPTDHAGNAPEAESVNMSARHTLFTLAAISFAAWMSPASSQTLRYANQGDLKSLDPYTLNESTTHAHLGQIYEGLT